MSDEVIKRDTIQEGALNEVPEMYLSPTNTPSPSRLKQINVYSNLPYIAEYFEGGYQGISPVVINFKGTYKNPPLVLGLIKNSSGVARKYTVNTDANTSIGKNSCNVYLSSGETYRLRVYNLDISE